MTITINPPPLSNSAGLAIMEPDAANGGTTFATSITGYGQVLKLPHGEANALSWRVTGDTGNAGTVGRHSPNLQVHTPANVTAWFTLEIDGQEEDRFSIGGGAAVAPSQADEFNFDADGNGLVPQEIAHGQVLRIKAWADRNPGGGAPLAENEKPVITLSHMRYDPPTGSVSPGILFSSNTLNAFAGVPAQLTGTFAVGTSTPATISVVGTPANAVTFSPTGGQTADGNLTVDIANPTVSETITLEITSAAGTTQRSFDLVVNAACAKPVVTLAVDDTSNPGNIRITTTATTSNPGARIVSDRMEVDHSGGTEVLQTPNTSGKLDFSAYIGQAVTLRYAASDNCPGAAESDEVSVVVNVPNFTVELTLDPSQPRTATNSTNLEEMLGDLVDGCRVRVSPPTSGGVYQIHGGLNGGAVNRFRPTGLDNYMIEAVGTVVLDGNYSVATGIAGSNGYGAFLLSGSTNCVWKGFICQNSRRSFFSTGSSSADVTTRNCRFRDYYTRGIQMVGCNRTSSIGDTFERALRSTVSEDGPRANGAAFGNGCTNTVIEHFTVTDSAEDGFSQDDGTADMVHIVDGTITTTGRQGIVVDHMTNIFIERNDITAASACPVQIEDDTVGFVVRDNILRNSNTYENGGAGEPGAWCNDAQRGIFERNEVHNCSSGLRLDGNPDQATPPPNPGSQYVIARFNRFYNNNGHPSFPAFPAGDYGSMKLHDCDDCYIYNNTFWDNGFETPSHAGAIAGCYSDTTRAGSSNARNVFVNNISGNHKNNAGGYSLQVRWVDAGSEFSKIDNNIWAFPPQAISYQTGPSTNNFAGYQANMAPKEATSVEADPLLDTNLRPQSGSPAIGAAIPIGTITGVAGTTLDIDNSRAFWEGDWVLYGNGNAAKVLTVTDTQITVDDATGVTNGMSITHYNARDVGGVQTVEVP